MFAKFENIHDKLLELEGMLSDPAVLANQSEYGKVTVSIPAWSRSMAFMKSSSG